MGNCSCFSFLGNNATYTTLPAEVSEKAGAVHMLVVTLDYNKDPNYKLTCSTDGENVVRVARASGVALQNIVRLQDENATVNAVEAAIKQMGSKCKNGDLFFFYFAGHGVNVKDYSGDEQDGLDECFVFVDNQGKIDQSIHSKDANGHVKYKAMMTDDVFAKLVTDSVKPGTKVVIMSDCCHSGTIGDLKKPIWNGREALTLSGCRDNQTSGDTGKGGIFTHSLCIALEKLQKSQRTNYSIQELYDETVRVDDSVYKSKQDIQMQCVPGCNPRTIRWPLIPEFDYEAPRTQRWQGC